MEQLITVATFNAREPADSIATRLRAAGIGAEVYDESNEQKWKLFNLHPRAHLRVRVHSTEEERALAELRALSGDAALALAVQCPQCGSSMIEFPEWSRRTLLGALPAVLGAAGVIEQNYFCGSCQFTWPAEPPKQGPELDALNWPKR